MHQGEIDWVCGLTSAAVMTNLAFFNTPVNLTADTTGKAATNWGSFNTPRMDADNTANERVPM